MEWNCCWSVKTITPFLFESIGDSEDLKSNVHHDHEEDDKAVIMDEQEGVSCQLDDKDDVDGDNDDDDAQSCSYDHSSYISMTTRYEDSQHDQSQRMVYDDEDGNNIQHHDDDQDDDDDGSMIMVSSKKQKRSHKFCVDHSIDQRENDRKFWEACLAT
ncbi:hypothetical protein QVD17_17059 [Tagetes erecta]|uniref:Uncharacterized protein n=1 Tax=Tagetes erecta TaxID=13708 RepID=A0AAD8KYS5_TARER|nr:hypothetical protein QVD17_17059 [Tagetes erecta]